MNLIESLQHIGNHALALKTARYLLNVYQIGLSGCQDNNEKEELRKAFSEILQTQI